MSLTSSTCTPNEKRLRKALKVDAQKVKTELQTSLKFFFTTFKEEWHSYFFPHQTKIILLARDKEPVSHEGAKV